MEEDHEPKHVCKFCSKSFRCERSLGSHMRSHDINNSSQKDEKLELKKLSSVNNGYRLRENPKKTWRFAAISVEVILQDKSCKECGKGFHSWKALFGHMKCHSEKVSVANNLEEHQDSWTDENSNQKLVMDRQSDNDLSAPNRRKRSERRTRCVTTPTSTFSLTDPPSVSDSKHEQEEVALSLMMLSRDVGSWGALNSVTESSENESMYSQARRPDLINQIEDRAATSDLRKPTEQRGEKGKLRILDFVEKDQGQHSETLTSEFSKTISKMKRTRESVNGFLDRLKNSHCDGEYQPQETHHKLGNKLIKEIPLADIKSSCEGYTSIKRKFSDLYDCEVRKSNPLKQISTKVSGAQLCSNSHIRSKFECTTCNKVFSSYQALGGHRASHGRTVACSVIESSDKSTETDLSPEETDYSNIMESGKKEYQEDTSARRVKKNKGHECSICFKVFTSGQALGGHKRSHLIAYTDIRNRESLIIQKTVSEMRDFLDLNLPASAEEESNDQISTSSPPWWLSTNYKHEEISGVVSS